MLELLAFVAAFCIENGLGLNENNGLKQKIRFLNANNEIFLCEQQIKVKFLFFSIKVPASH